MPVPRLHRLRPPLRPSTRLLSNFPVQPTLLLLRRPATPPVVSQELRHYSSWKKQHRQSFFERLRDSWNDTKVEWYSIPVGLGIGVVAFAHLRNVRNRDNKEESGFGSGGSESGSGKGIRPMGSWQVQVLSTLPLKALSYYWGKFNEIPLPVFLRVPGFKLYSWVFGVNLAEVEEDDLRSYRNLAEFFYRRLKPGCRPIDARLESVVSPADGKVLQFGEVYAGGKVEQVKGMTYSLDALLGMPGPTHSEDKSPNPSALVKAKLEGKGIDPETTEARYGKGGDGDKDSAIYQSDEEFANVNGISYTLPSLLSGDADQKASTGNPEQDVSMPSDSNTVAEVGSDLAKGVMSSWWGGDIEARKKRLFFAVVYLAPGDYHRFHSPVNWVVERRRHFAGELYSVSPYIQNRLPNLFTLNERVVLLGRWKYGMFSMTPVGATNVGSIKIHFDRELRTNSLTHDATKADSEGGFAEANYKGASLLLGGYPVAKGGEIGGFNLGSTVVLVFEAPGSSVGGEPGRGGFRFTVQRGQYIKVGEALGVVEDS